jgi:thiol-disulfide isomerase/thioredoxin
LNHAIQLGPILLPLTLLLVLLSAGTSLALGKWLSKNAPAEVEQVLWHSLLVGVVCARLAFVYEYRALYLASPLSILDIRDGGWNPTFGLIGAWAVALYRERKTPGLRKPVRWALASGTAIFACGTAALVLQPGSGQRLPDLTFQSLEGKDVRLSDFEGKPTVVNLWATWCPPCVREMPVLHQAQVQHPNVHFVFLNQGEDHAQVARWLGSQGLSLRHVLIDPKRQAGAAFQQKGYPTTLFFDAKGELVSLRVGELSSATLNERLDRIGR